jgi:beta-galactosidase
VPFDDNMTGSYLVKFSVPNTFTDNQLRLRFEGVDAAFHLWLNGKEIGYSQGSRNPSEFDITSHVNDGENTLAVRVYQLCDGTYIEGQGEFLSILLNSRNSKFAIDQWWLSGIFRDVFLLAFPNVHIKDFHIQTLIDEHYTDATLSVSVDIRSAEKVCVKLLEGDKTTVVAQDELYTSDGSVLFSLKVINPRKWTAEDPYLYHVILTSVSQVIAQRIGFRKVELKDGLFLVNGKRIVFRGVNRHEHHPTKGRAVGLELLRHDLLLMKKSNINALRTSHQPNDYRLYDLADELGLWLIDEADLECHGFDSIRFMKQHYPQMSKSNRSKRRRLSHMAGLANGFPTTRTGKSPILIARNSLFTEIKTTRV